MEFPADLIPGRFVERPNRFLTVVECGRRRVQAHLPNTGRLRELLVPGKTVYLAPARNRNRKTQFSLVLAELDRRLVCLDSGVPAVVAAEHFSRGAFPPFAGYDTVRREVSRFGSRYDLVLTRPTTPELIVEVKGVTLVRMGRALFPDAPTDRGRRHIEGLIEARAAGIRAAVVFIIMRSDSDSFAPNAEGDPRFSRAVGQAREMGVEVYALSCRVTTGGVWVDRRIEVVS